jgi:hypothetical protein
VAFDTAGTDYLGRSVTHRQSKVNHAAGRPLSFKREIAPKLDAFTLAEIAPPQQACRSQPARASGPVPGCRIRGIGNACSR